MLYHHINNLYSNDAEDDNDEQTQGMASSRRNLASIFVVASRTLGKPVAPDYHYGDADDLNTGDKI